MTDPRPDLRWGASPDHPRGLVLVLHGATSRGLGGIRWFSPPVLRMVPFAWAIEGFGKHELAVARLKYAVPGWEAAQVASAVVDARWALHMLRERYPDTPIAVVGHSMGGRVALHLAGDDDVSIVVALAPWVDKGDRRFGRPGLRVLLAHGAEDRITSAAATTWLAGQLTAQGADVALDVRPGEKHALLRQPRYWHRRVAEYLVHAFAAAPTTARGD